MDRRSLLGATAALLCAPALAQQAYPNRPVRMVVPLPPGGATDIWARLVAEPMSQSLGQPVVIENRAGAGGMIGTEAVKNAAPDGYTFLFHIASFVQTPVVLRRWPYQPLEDFAFIGKFGTTPLPFCVRADVPATTLAELVAYARGRQLSYGTYSPGSSGHAFAQAFSDANNLNMEAVHYRGEAPLQQDMLGGRIPCAFLSMTASGDHIRSGRFRPLAALGLDGVPTMPQIPSFVSQGYPRDIWGRNGFIGTFAPVRTPQPVLDRLVEAFRFAMTRPDVLRRLAEMDTIALYLPPAEFREDVASYMAFWQSLVNRLGIAVEG